jgi:hypothetical protein
MSLERAFFVGTGYRALDAADTQTIAVSVEDVAVIACAYMLDHTPVVCLYSADNAILAALPWPDTITTDALAVRWAIGELAMARPTW